MWGAEVVKALLCMMVTGSLFGATHRVPHVIFIIMHLNLGHIVFKGNPSPKLKAPPFPCTTRTPSWRTSILRRSISHLSISRVIG